jgi:WD40 repeat protein/carbon monoxide dehydrogenase subunit G
MAMELDHSFSVPVPPDRAWGLMFEVEKIAASIPDATVEGFDGDVITGRMKLKVGPVALTYRGTATFTERDGAAHVVVLEVAGKETRGAGTASATIRISLKPDFPGGGTLVHMHTTMNVTGRPAQFGRGVIVQVSGKLIDRFAADLAARIAADRSILDEPILNEPSWDEPLRIAAEKMRSRPGPPRRAVSIGVERFSDPHEHLTFAPKLVGELSQVLGALGYETTARAETQLASAGLGAALREHLDWADADGVLIVHVVTHGQVADGNATIYLLGSDGQVHQDTDVAHWLTSLHNVGTKPLTLFLLDMCQAGTAARLPWQALASGSVRGWVIAASRGDRPAYDGRFTRAVTNVLYALAMGELDIDPVLEHVPMDTVARAIGREVNRLAAAEDAYPQQVTATLVDISAGVPELPFFPNPAYRDDPRAKLRADLDPGLTPFLDDLDEGLDARHFVERAAGAGPLPEAAWDLRGCFTGRAEELRRLSPWLSGEGDAPLHVVTGSPGVGKSALLGVLVCAAHPMLREQTRAVWGRIAQRPLLLRDLAAVHARRRGVAAVTQSLARQLRLAETGASSELVSVVAERPRRPVIVIDALDEADDGVALMNELLLPLATARREDGSPAVRLLVGVRPYEEYAPLLEAATAAGGFVDLDDVPGYVLEDDLYQYVNELLRADSAYRRSGATVGAFAAEVARVLSEQAGERREWGEFLVAGLYTRHLLVIHPEPPDDPTAARSLGARTPRTLPEVLELDLNAQRAGPLLSEVVTVLAHARGQGMPLTVVTRLLASKTTEAVQQALHDGRFYLRQSTDSDGTTLYRLFHQGLADHLRQRSLPDLLSRLLAALGPTGARNWQAAEPYLLRHAIDHAIEAGDVAAVLGDPGFLLRPDAATLLPMLTGRLADVYRASLDISTRPPRVNRAALALNAVRAGMPELADAIAAVPGEPILTWRPRWIVGRPKARPSVVRTPIAVTGGQDGTIRIWDLTTQQPIGNPMTGHQGAVLGLATGQLDGKPIAVTGGNDGTVRIWDLTTQQPIGNPITGHQGGIRGVATGQLDGKPIAVTGGNDRTVRIWDLTTQQPIGNPITGHQGGIRGVATGQLDGKPIAVTGGNDRTVRIWDLTTQQPIGNPITGHQGGIRGVATGQLDGKPIAVIGGRDGTVRIRDLTTQQPIGTTMTGGQGSIMGLAIGHLEDRPIAVTGGNDGTVRIWDLITRQPIGDPMIGLGHRGWVDAPALGHLDGRPIVVSGGNDGTVRIWDLTTRQPIGITMTGHRGAAYGPTIAELVTGHGDERVSDELVRLTSDKGEPVVRSLAITETPTGRMAVLGNEGGRVALVDLATGRMVHDVSVGSGLILTAIACGQIAGQLVAVLAAEDGRALILDLRSGDVFAAASTSIPLPTARPGLVVGLIVVDGKLTELQGGTDGSVVWQRQQYPHRHDGPVRAVACMYVHGQALAFTGGDDGTVRVWELPDMRQLDVIDVGRPVFAIEATVDGDLLVGAGGEAIAFWYAGSAS